MHQYPETAQEQSISECRTLAFSVWSVLYLNLISRNENVQNIHGLTGCTCDGVNGGPDQSALSRLIQCGITGSPMPDELTLRVLIQLMADIRADVWLKCTRPNGQFRQCLFVRALDLDAQVSELFQAGTVVASQSLVEEGVSYDVPLSTLFPIAAKQGYRLTIRLLYDNQVVAGSAFFRRHPQMRSDFEQYVRIRLRRPSR